MPDTVPQFSAKTWRAPNLAISSIAGNIQLHHEVILADLVLKRKNLLSSIKKAIDYLHNNNILIVGGMIIGHSEDKEEDIAQNFEFFDKANIDFYGGNTNGGTPRFLRQRRYLRPISPRLTSSEYLF